MKHHKIYSILLLMSLMAVSCQQPSNDSGQSVKGPDQEEVLFHPSHEPQKKGVPFSDAVQVGNIYFLSGQIGMDHSVRELVIGGVEAETRQALVNIKSVLAHHGLEMKDVVKATVILADIDDFGAFNGVYRKYFPQKPARTTFAASGLARGAKVEIEVVAVNSKGSR